MIVYLINLYFKYEKIKKLMLFDRIHLRYLPSVYIKLLLSLVLFSCSAPPPPKPIVMPPTKLLKPELNKESLLSLGYISGYEIWEFLRDGPSEDEVLDTFGLPDSVWLDDGESTKFLYYFISEMQDYNTIEISTKSDSVSGFEWD